MWQCGANPHHLSEHHNAYTKKGQIHHFNLGIYQSMICDVQLQLAKLLSNLLSFGVNHDFVAQKWRIFGKLLRRY